MIKLAPGQNHFIALALNELGETCVYSWGDNTYGQLGRAAVCFVGVFNFFFFLLFFGIHLFFIFLNFIFIFFIIFFCLEINFGHQEPSWTKPGVINIPSSSGEIVDIAAGKYHSLALSSSLFSTFSKIKLFIFLINFTGDD